MKSTFVMAFIITVALFGAAAPGMAHHSSAMFDQSKTVTLEGVVKKWELTNPHSWLWVDVKGKDGKVSRAEALAAAEAAFARADTNGDGFISAEEAQAARKAHRGSGK